MVDEQVVRERLGALRLNSERLRRIIESGRDRFLADEDVFLKAERCLQLCLQAILDIGAHIIAAETLERPAGYEDVIPSLERAGIVRPELVERLAGTAGLRNILVHDYLAVDLGLLFEDVSAGLGDFDDFASAIEDFLNRPGEQAYERS